ncbi:expressed unknown protein [Seminavis robusta]|uniref:Uncharacterized protein n=1 Tax=Seminavis robusta TaxID=568900 RepID=A0A9N8ESZ0_9STRA|nr:expressed unknown protein [Seminavis robusta]|eukprot:Sro1545_g281340.1 n/a (275) ;mRNA; f:19606-20655
MSSSNVNMPSPETFDDEYDDESMEEQVAAKNAKVSLAMRIMTTFTLVSMGVNAAVLGIMFSVTKELVYVSLVASSFAILVGLLVVKRQIIDMAPTHTLRFIHNKLRRKVHHLYLENNKLKEHVDDLESNVKELGDVENQLSDITKKQDSNVDDLVKLVKENGTLTNQMTRLIMASAAMQMMDLALDSDRDESNLFSDDEIDSLLRRLENIEGIKVNETALREHIKEDNSLQSIMAMLQYARTYAHKYPPGSGKTPPMGEDAPCFTFDVEQVVAQ